MSKEMFLTRCDKCEEKSEQYTVWPTCRSCGLDICDDCDVESERGDEENPTTLCKDCNAEIIRLNEKEHSKR